MVNYGEFNIVLDDCVNEALVEFSYDYCSDISVEEMFSKLIAYGLVELGYLDLTELPWENDDCICTTIPKIPV